ATLSRDGAAERLRRADDHELEVGRLHLDERRPAGRLHVLVHERVLRPFGDDGRSEALADAHRRVQVPRLRLRRTTARARFARARALPTARTRSRLPARGHLTSPVT